MTYESIKPSVIAGIRRYADEHCPTGSFLRSVLSNDLIHACLQADDDNIRVIPEIVKYCYNEIPNDCWGSSAKYNGWIEPRGRV
jgi:hypothetical protein